MQYLNNTSMAIATSGFETFLKFPNFLRSQETPKESCKTDFIKILYQWENHIRLISEIFGN